MEQSSFFDKLYYIYESFLNNSYFVWTLLISLIFLFVMLCLIMKKNTKSKKIIIVIYLISIIALFIMNSKVLLNSLDKAIDFIITSIYFPNFIVYVIMILITNINFIYIILGKYKERDILSTNERSVVNIIQVVVFVVLQFFFVLVLRQIFISNIDVLSRVSLYSDYLIVALIQISTTTFVLKYASTFIIWIVRKIKTDNLFDPSKRVVFNNSILFKKLDLTKESVLKNAKVKSKEETVEIIDFIELPKDDFVVDYVKERTESEDVSKEELKILKDMVEKYNEDIIKKD